MESFHAVLRSILARIQQIPLRIPSPEEVLPVVASRRAAYAAPATTWGTPQQTSTTRSYLDVAPPSSPGVHPRRLRRSSLPWRWCPESLGIHPLPTPRGLLTCQPMI